MSAWDHFSSLPRELSDSPYFAWIADDDTWRPAFFESAVSVLKEHREIDVVWPSAHRVNRFGQVSAQLNPDVSGMGQADRQFAWQSMPTWAAFYAVYRSDFLRRMIDLFRYQNFSGSDVLFVNQVLQFTSPILLLDPPESFRWYEWDPAIDAVAPEVQGSYASTGHAQLYVGLVAQTLSSKMSLREKGIYSARKILQVSVGASHWRHRLHQYIDSNRWRLFPSNSVGAFAKGIVALALLIANVRIAVSQKLRG